MTPARASEPFDHPKRHAHAVIEVLVLDSGTVAEVLDQPVLEPGRGLDAHHVAAVDQLLFHLVFVGLDDHRRLLEPVGGAGRRRRSLGQRLEPGRRRRLLRGERQRKSEQGDGEHSAKHGASLSFWDNARQARARLEKVPLEKTLLLVDGSSYLYRAFHALPDLRNAAGEPTGAIYGVLNMLRKLLADYKADYVACVFDARGKTFRDDMYDKYKANRPPMPDDLGSQIEPLFDAIRASGWPLVQVDGVEADDVIGTLALEADRRGLRCVISTGDKDLAQLVSGRVTLVNTMSNERLDPEGVKAKFGVSPDRMLDYLTLVGDSVDNVPGVEKVGPKTAAKWVAQYGSLEGVMQHAPEINGAVGENLRKALDWLPKARAILAVKCDVALPFGLEDLRLAPRDDGRLTELLSRFGFRSWLKEAPPAAPEARPPTARAEIERHYETLSSEADLERWLAEIEAAGLVSLVAETTSEEPMQARLVGASFSIAEGRAAYLPLAHGYAGAPSQIGVEKALARLKPWLESDGRAKLGHN